MARSRMRYRRKSPERQRRAVEVASPLINEHPESDIEYWPALLTLFPELAGRLPFVSLRGAAVTSAPRRLIRSRHLFGDNTVYLKNEVDDFHVLPENKARKLEFALGHVLTPSTRRLVSFGYIGSPHCYSVAKTARDRGLAATVVLQKAPLTIEAIEMVAALRHMGAKVKLRATRRGLMFSAAWQWLLSRFLPIKLVPPSDSWSCLGHANAILELKEQIAEGILEKPDIIYVPVGSGSTLVGMEIGKRLADLDSIEIVGVQGSDIEASDLERLSTMGNEALAILNQHLKEPLVYSFKPSSFTVLRDYAAGASHGEVSKVMAPWIMSLEELEGVDIESVYAAKAAYALYDQIQKRNLKDKIFLLWNTTCPFRTVDLPRGFMAEDSPWRLKRWIRDDQKQGRLLQLPSIR